MKLNKEQKDYINTRINALINNKLSDFEKANPVGHSEEEIDAQRKELVVCARKLGFDFDDGDIPYALRYARLKPTKTMQANQLKLDKYKDKLQEAKRKVTEELILGAGNDAIELLNKALKHIEDVK